MSRFKQLVSIKNWKRSSKTVAIILMATVALVLILSALFLAGAWLFGDGARSAADVPLILVNAFVVALAAMGAYETALKKQE